jgi:putative cell wall-binding protein
MADDAKPVQFPMSSSAYAILKRRAKHLGLSTGKLVENLLASMELRLQRAYVAAHITEIQVSEKSDKLMIEAILIGDGEGWSDNWENKKMAQYLSFVRKDILDDVNHLSTWTPKIHIADDDAEKEE